MKEMIDLHKPSKTLFGKLCFLICFISYSILGSGQYSGTGTFTKITALASLTDGYYVIAYGTTTAMNSTNTASYFGNTGISPSGSVITNPAAAIVWKIQTNGTAKTIYNEAASVYASYNGSSNAAYTSATVTGNPEKWTFAYTSSLFTITSVNVTSRLLQYNSSSPRFACYAGTQQNITLYKMALSSDATLSNLTMSSGTLAPVFGSATTSYTASVTNATSSVTVTPTRNDPNAIIQVRVNGGTYASVTSGSPSGSLALNVGSNTIDVLVTAQDGTTQTYTVTVTRAAAGGNTLTTTAGSFGPYCNSSANSVTLNFTQTGTFTGTYNIQISDASGTFPADATSQLLTYVSNTGSSVTATIPASYTAGTGYRIRIVNNTPTYYASGDNGSNITMLAAPTTPVAATPPAVCAGTSATITGAGSTGATSYTYWTASTGGSSVAAGTTPAGTVSGNNLTTPTSAASGSYIYYVQANNASCASTARQAVTITVNALPANPSGTITASPSPGCGSSSLSYSSPSGAVFWETAAGGTGSSNPTTSSYPLSSSSTIYARAYDGTCWSGGTVNSGAVTINTAISITTQPSAANVVAPAGATYTVAASGTISGYQWQVNTGTSWANVSSGGTTASLSVTPTTVAMSGYQYRCIVKGTSPCADVTSNAVTLTVAPGPCISETFGNICTSSCSPASSSYATRTWTGDNGTSWTATDARTDQNITASNAAITVRNGTLSSATIAGGIGSLTLTTRLPFSDPDGTLSVTVNGTPVGTIPYATATQTTTIPNINVAGNVVVVITSTGDRVTMDNLSWTCYTSCPVPDAIGFVSAPSSTEQGAPMNNVTVRAYCSASGTTASNYTGNITLTASGGGCGYAGQTVAAVAGVATFSNIIFTRSPQSGITLTASAPGFTSVESPSFDVTVPSGTPFYTTIFNEDFDGSSPGWGYTIGTPTYSGSGSGTDDIGVFDFGGTFHNSLYKSFTADNSASEKKSTNTITFNNATGLSVYTYVTWTFSVGSIGSGTGAGVDAGDDMIIQTSLDGGSTWSTLLTYYGSNDYLIPLSTSSPAALAYNANASYVKPSQQSAFTVVLPGGTSQFKFRMTATDNRTNENWVIDNLSLIGTTIPTNAPRRLPTAIGDTFTPCPLSDATISVSSTNTRGTMTYLWSPTTNFVSTSTATDAAPVVNFNSGSATYTVTITDADGCTAAAADIVNITGPAGSPLLAPATVTLVEVHCQDANGWTYYADPSDPAKWEFAIYKNGNTFTADVDLTVKTTANTAYDTKQDIPAKKATFTLGRYWNATVTTGSIDPAKPIKARFYYDASDLSTMTSAAQAFATANSSTAHAVEWFKTTTTNTYDPANNTIVDVPNKLSYSLFSTALSTQSGVNYTEYTGLTGFSGGTAGIRVSPTGGGLPVKLLYLTANAMENRYIKLDWATATEINNLGFDLERSVDGINFEKIVWVDGNGNSNSQINYTDNDNAVVPNAIYYYRLRQVDNDGHYEYSNVVSAMIFGEKGFVMENLKPNPATNSVIVNVVTDAAQPVDVAITNMLGQQVLSQQWELGAGLNGTTLDISAIAQGVYHVTVRSADSYYTKTLAITR